MNRVVVSALTAFALAFSPAMASAQSARQPAARSEVAPASERADGETLRGGVLIPLLVLVTIITGILVVTRNHHNTPKSP
jgi:hypothetical protein